MADNKKKRKRRYANGEGSIIKLSGKRKRPYAVRITTGWTKEGKQIIKYLSYHEKITDAKLALREYMSNPYNLDKPTLKKVFEDWIAKADLKEGTLYNHRNSFNKLEPLHNKEICKIKLKELEDILGEYKPTVQNTIRKTLRNIYKYALKHDYVVKDITKHLEVDKHTNVKDINIFTPDEIQKLWDNVGNEYFDDMPLFLLYTGLRISELLNIKIEDINLKDNYINIPDSKTKNGIRIVPIHKKILPLLIKRYDVNNKHLFLNPVTKRKQTYANFIKNYWTLEHTRHEARHTFVSYITKVVHDRITVKLLVGHSKSDITDSYTHRTFEELSKAINKLEYK